MSKRILCSGYSFYNYYDNNPRSRTNTNHPNTAEESKRIFDALLDILRDNSYSTPATNDLSHILFISSVNSILIFNSDNSIPAIKQLYGYFKPYIKRASYKHFHFVKKLELLLVRLHLLRLLIFALSLKQSLFCRKRRANSPHA